MSNPKTKIVDEKSRCRLLNITINTYDLEKLEDISKFNRYNKSATIKNLINAEWEKKFNENGDSK